MEMTWIGHAGVLVREGDVMIAIDPFLTGTFLWDGREETYQGRSPWIGTRARMETFLDLYATEITAVAITHAHGDHCDLPFLTALLTRNPEIQILAPYPVTDWLRASAVLDKAVTQFCIPVEWGGIYNIEGQTNHITLSILPNPGIPEEKYPYRVGFAITNPDGVSVTHPGDAHEVGPWEHFQSPVTDLITWGPKHREDIVRYFMDRERPPKLRRVWWIHWEPFTPGNFTCSQDPKDLFVQDLGVTVENQMFEYGKWVRIGD